MKRFISVFILILFLTSSCGPDPEKVIIGEWQVEEVIISGSELEPDIIKLLSDEMKSSIYTFNKDGSFVLHSGLIPNGANGSWRINLENEEVFLEYKASGFDYKSSYPYEIIDDDHIHFIQDLGNGRGKMTVNLSRK